MENSTKNFYLVHLNVVYDGIVGGYNVIGEIDSNSVVDRETIIENLVSNSRLEDMDDVECIESVMLISEKDYSTLVQMYGHVWFGPCGNVSGTDLVCKKEVETVYREKAGIDLVEISLNATAPYSGNEYYEHYWIKKESYEKIKEDLPSEESIPELDGKYSEVFGDIITEEYGYKTDEEYAKAGKISTFDNDGEILKRLLPDLYSEAGLDFDSEQDEINEYFNNLDCYVDLNIKVPESLVPDIEELVKKYIQENK